ncbi:MAG: hypothetical protein H0U47_08420, partial [Nocardioidaceae bacterium]|nr:hypothetical protein [Nocardioidaceae bacterium]
MRRAVAGGSSAPPCPGQTERTSREEAIAAVAESTPGNPPTDFGTNEWLVEEMYDRYSRDPDSVDRAWLEFFQDRGSSTDSS